MRGVNIGVEIPRFALTPFAAKRFYPHWVGKRIDRFLSGGAMKIPSLPPLLP